MKIGFASRTLSGGVRTRVGDRQRETLLGWPDVVSSTCLFSLFSPLPLQMKTIRPPTIRFVPETSPTPLPSRLKVEYRHTSSPRMLERRVCLSRGSLARILRSAWQKLQECVRYSSRKFFSRTGRGPMSGPPKPAEFTTEVLAAHSVARLVRR